MRLLVLGDSLTFHGPDQAHPPSDPRLWPNIAADDADVVAQIGWTARDAWWALGTSGGFQVVVLGLAAWIFARRDF